MKLAQALDVVIPVVRRHRRLLGVGFFLGVLLTVFQVSGLRDHFNLAFMREVILQHRIGGLLLFVLLFSLGNLIQIPGWIFLAAAVLFSLRRYSRWAGCGAGRPRTLPPSLRAPSSS